MFFRCVFVLLLASLSLLFLCLSLSIHKKLTNRQRRKTEQREQQQQQRTDPTREAELPGEVGPGGSTRPLLLPEKEGGDGEPGSGAGRADPGGKMKKRRARAKKKKKGSDKEDRGADEKGNNNEGGGEEEEGFSGGREREDFLRSYPFTSSSSGTQRKIKLQYDEIIKHHRSKELTFTQVAHFAHCLVEAKNELQHKADVIQRKFTIKKALLLKADRSSFDRLRQQIYKLELEQKRLEEDAFVYNWLQQQLKLSPAYKKMLEIGACMESEANSGELRESEDTEYSDISFEELLAQEKKDSFWQRNGKLRPCSG